MRILLAEDEETIRIPLADALTGAGHHVQAVDRADEALAALDSEGWDLVVTDVRMPGGDGMSILRHARSVEGGPEVVMITGYATVSQAVEAMRAGAVTYVQKPFPHEAILELAERLGRLRRLEDENRRLRSEAGTRSAWTMLGQSPAMRRVHMDLERAAGSDAGVLVWGPSGSGKDHFARCVHQAGRRAGGPFGVVECGALPEGLAEDEFFGHERGAFTGAVRLRRGALEAADGGTLYLDGIETLDPGSQTGLLRVLESGQVQRIGSDRALTIDVRVIASAGCDPRAAVEEGTLREDLFYRLAVLEVQIPTLAERRDDIALLAAHFLALDGGDDSPRLSGAALAAMEEHPWPGHVRELRNTLQRATSLVAPGASIGADDLGLRTRDQVLDPLADVLDRTERAHIQAVLSSSGGVRTAAAETLGIGRQALWKKMKKYGLS